MASGQRPAASSHFSVHVRAVGAGRFFQSLRRCARCKQGSHCALTCMESELGAKSQYRCRPPCRQIGLSCRCAGPVSGLRRRPPARPSRPPGPRGRGGQMAWELNGKGAIPRCASCVYSKCSARDSTDIDFNGQRNGQLHSARRSVEDRLTAIRRRADNCPCAVWQPAPSVAGRQRWGIRAGRERRLAIRSRRAHKAIVIIAAEGRIQPVRHSTRYL